MIHEALIAIYHLLKILVFFFHSVLCIVKIRSPGRISKVLCHHQKKKKKNSHYHQLNAVFFDLLLDLIETLAVHRSRAIGHQHNLPFVLELFTVSDDHLDGKDDSRDS